MKISGEHVAIKVGLTLNRPSYRLFNQAKKFGQLIECNMRNIFLAKYGKRDGETIPRPFSRS